MHKKERKKVDLFSCVQLFGTPWTVAYQAPPSMGFSRQEYWSGLPFPSPGDLSNPGIEPGSSSFWADALQSEPPGKLQRFLNKLEIELPYDPAILLLGMHTEETRIERDTCTPMFITALFIIARIWKQPRCPSADEWIRKLWYIYTMEYYSAIKRDTFESVLMRWMKLEPIIQSEVSQKEKHQYSILTHIYGI